jgi:hypothetical protein
VHVARPLKMALRNAFTVGDVPRITIHRDGRHSVVLFAAILRPVQMRQAELWQCSNGGNPAQDKSVGRLFH